MSNDFRFSKAEVLYQLGEFSEAEKILKEMLSQESNNVKFLTYFAEVNLKQGKHKAAREAIENAIGLVPDNLLLFYRRGQIALFQEANDEAQMNLKRCIELAPGNAEYFAFLAYIKLERKEFEEALTLADQALKLDAENLQALNTRSTALLELNRKTESFDTFEGALREAPNNEYTHANYGWALLKKGEHQKAREHFKEALKIDPNSGFAQAGLFDAIKATNPLYKVYLKYAFFVTFKFQWGVVIAFYLGLMGLRYLPDENEMLKPYLHPLTAAALAVSLFLTRIIYPISNFFLRFNKYGYRLLTKGQRISSCFVTVSFVVFITGAVLYIFTKEDKFLPLAFFGFAMMAPLGDVFSPSKQELMLFLSTVYLFLTGFLGISISFIYHDINNIFSMFFYIVLQGLGFLPNFFR